MSNIVSGNYLTPDARAGDALCLSTLRGIGCVDRDCTAFLVERPATEVIEALSQLVSFTDCGNDCYGEKIRISENPIIVVFQFKDSNWSVILPSIHYSQSLFQDETAEHLSMGLKTTALCCYYSSENTSSYAVFTSGKLVEKLAYVDTKIRGYEASNNIDDVLDQLIEGNEEVITDHYYRYINEDNYINTVSTFDSDTMFQDMLLSQGAYLPSVLWSYPHNVGDIVDFSIVGINSTQLSAYGYFVVSESQ